MNTYEYIIDKYKLDIGSQYIVDIPGIGRNDMAKLFGELGFNLGAEVGVEQGFYSEILCQANPKLHLYSIDPWTSSAYEPETTGVSKTEEQHLSIYEEAKKRLFPYNCTIVRKMSLDALSDFEDNSLDFVYIDANHDFPNFINDLHQWTKKVRMGGIISGHDYAFFSYRKFNHVKRALQAYARCYRMIPLFIVGAEEYQDGVTRDPYRSWFWVKDK